MKKIKLFCECDLYLLLKTFRIMRIVLFLLLVSILQTFANDVYSQKIKLSIDFSGTKLENVLDEIEDLTEFYFLYNEKLIDTDRAVTLSVKNQKIEEILDKLFVGTDVVYTITDRKIILTPSSLFNNKQQQQSVTGKVTDSDGQPLPGVTIVVKGTTLGIITDVDGNYTLSNIPEDAILQFSFVGMKAQEIEIGDQMVINVTLLEETIGIEEVVAIGYGVQRKKDLTTSVSTVDVSDVEKKSMINVSQAIEGKASGVRVIQASGKPQGDFTIQVRGATSINAGNEPLYVVDGVPTSSINGISPVDIQSIQILKDASSCAIYGARASNGVVLIATKRGKSGSPRVSLRSVYGISKVAKMIDLLDAKECAQLLNEEKMNAGLDPIIDPGTITSNINWQDEIFFTGKTSDTQLSFSGGNEKTQFYLSTSYLTSEGILKPSDYKRYSLRVNLDHEMYSWLSLGVSINLRKSEEADIMGTDPIHGEGLILSALSYTVPYTSKYNSNGDFGANPHQGGWYNPYYWMYGSDKNTRNSNLLANLFTKIDFTKNFSFKTSFAVDTYFQNYDQFDLQENSEYNRSTGGNAIVRNSQQFIWLNENILDYNYSSGKHVVTALAGITSQNSKRENSSMQKQGFPDDKIRTLNAGATLIDASTNKSEWKLQSYLFRLTYAFDNKYLVSANFRADGSSKFGKNHKYGYFPSASLGWRISQENFFSEINVINDMKLRVSYGLTGNQNGIDDYGHLGLIGLDAVYPFNGIIYPGSYPSTIANSDLKWELTKQTDIGFDLSLFKSRMLLTADIYFKNTSDLLLNVNLSTSSGYSNGIQNIGKISNKGLEFQLSTRNLTGNFKWSTDFNFSLNRNKVVDIGGEDKIIFTAGIIRERGNVTIIKEGEPLSVFYGYISEGVDPQAGDIVYKRNDTSDGKPYNPDTDRSVIGDPNPKFIYGMTNSFSYKNFSLSIFFQGVYGNDILNGTKLTLEAMEQVTNASASTLERWKNPGDITSMPRANFGNSDNSQISTRFIEKGSYLRVKDITLSYNMNSNWLKNVHVSNLNIFISAQNLLTFTNYSGFDPEISWAGNLSSEIDNSVSLGVDYGTYPNVRTFNLGFTLDF